MTFLSQNWWWLVLLVGALLMFSRRGRHGSSGFSHGNHGFRTGDAGHGEHPGASAPPTIATDPVTHKDVPTNHAVTSVFRARIYYFENAESRQRFEAAPEQYAREGLSYPISPEGRTSDRPRRRHGGC